MTREEINQRLEYLRGEIKNESISVGEIAELQSLAQYIEDGDVELLQWAGVPENEEEAPSHEEEDPEDRFYRNCAT